MIDRRWPLNPRDEWWHCDLCPHECYDSIRNSCPHGHGPLVRGQRPAEGKHFRRAEADR